VSKEDDMSQRSKFKTGWARMRAWQRGYRRAAMQAALAGHGDRIPERRSPRLARLLRDAGFPLTEAERAKGQAKLRELLGTNDAGLL
jgi:hypothetical protein